MNRRLLTDTDDIVLRFSRQIKDILHDKLSKVILYGSYARGDYRKNLDIDIMVLTPLTDAEIEKEEKNKRKNCSKWIIGKRLGTLKQLREKAIMMISILHQKIRQLNK